MPFMHSLIRTIFGKRLPITSGKLKVTGLHAPVRIQRDRYSIPYIHAENDEDAWFGLGFCQGQDRAFQIEMIYRMVRGTLSELVGPAALPMDRFARRVGFHRIARQEVALLDPDIRKCAEAFVIGMNTGISRGLKRKPHEYALLRSKPTTIDIADLLAYTRYMGFNLSPWTAKLTRLKILIEDGPEALKALNNEYPDWQPVTRPVATNAGKVINRFLAEIDKLSEYINEVGGSNNWALSPQVTATGRPILANDPHLGSIIPSQWYLALVRTPEWTLAGASFSGGFAFPSGFNGSAAWGVTAGLADNIDLYIEELSPDGKRVRNADGW